MEDPDTILKELRIDWENVTSRDFNPLHLGLKIMRDSVLNANFRDMFYKLERAMEQIISTDFRGFNASISEYGRFARTNRDLLASLGAIISASSLSKSSSSSIQAMITSLQEGIGVIETENERKELESKKYSMCREILQVKQMVAEIDSTEDLFTKSALVVKCLDGVDRAEYIRIRGVEEYRRLIYEKYLAIVAQVNRSLAEFIFKNKRENFQFFRCVVTLGSLNELDVFLKQNFKQMFHEAIEEVILRLYKLGDTKLDRLCGEVMGRIEAISRNMRLVTRESKNRFEPVTRENFFAEKTTPHRMCLEEEFGLDVISEELRAFVTRYTDSRPDELQEFDIHCVIDDLDYGKIYGEERPITRRLAEAQPSVGMGDEAYTLITAPRLEVAVALLRHATDPALKSVISDKIIEEYNQGRLESVLERIKYIFNAELLDIKQDTLELCLFEKIIELFKEYDTMEHRSVMKNYVDALLFPTFSRLFSDFFTSDFLTEFISDKSFSKFSRASLKESIFEMLEKNFAENVVSRLISRKDLILSAEKYKQVVCVLNTLSKFDGLLLTEKSSFLYLAFSKGFCCQIKMEFMYFFDLFFRQGSYQLYLRKMMRVPQLLCGVARDEKYFKGISALIEYYVEKNVGVMSVKDRAGLEAFLLHLKILDETLAAVEPDGSLASVYRLVQEVLSGNPSNKRARILSEKISSKRKL